MRVLRTLSNRFPQEADIWIRPARWDPIPSTDIPYLYGNTAMADMDYTFLGFYDLSILMPVSSRSSQRTLDYNPGALSSMSTLVDMISHDPNITDVRWAAYMLATVMWETTSLFTFEVQLKNKKGQPNRQEGQTGDGKAQKMADDHGPGR